MEPSKIKENIYTAYQQLLLNDQHLLSVDANERSITHKLAEYLQAKFPDWNVDCEFNRNGQDAKNLSPFVKKTNSDNTDAVSVYPDIIVHHRGTSENLIVIEAKKSNSRDEDMDNQKLCAYKKDLGYTYAYKIMFPIGSKAIDIPNYIQEI